MRLWFIVLVFHYAVDINRENLLTRLVAQLLDRDLLFTEWPSQRSVTEMTLRKSGLFYDRVLDGQGAIMRGEKRFVAQGFTGLRNAGPSRPIGPGFEYSENIFTIDFFRAKTGLLKTIQ